MDAPGALDSFRRLTTVLVEEAQLLGRVRGDVEFIKEEMECMNSLILQLTEAQYRDHLVRAWMKQVVGLTRDCEGNVEHYIHYVGSRPGDKGILGHLRRVLRFLRTIPVRHRIATRIQELKVRARDVGDRRQRYGVTVPASTRVDMNALDVEPSDGEQDLRRRAVLFDAAELTGDAKEAVRHGIDTLIKWLCTEPATTLTEDGVQPPQVRFFSIFGNESARQVALGVYKHSSVATIFGCKALSFYYYRQDVGTILAKILEEVDVQLEPGKEEDEVTNQSEGTTDEEDEVTNQSEGTTDEEDREKRLISKIQWHLKGKRFLIIVFMTEYDRNMGDWKLFLDALLQAADGCLPGSAIILTTRNYDLAMSFSPSNIINAKYLDEDYSFYSKAEELGLADIETSLNYAGLTLLQRRRSCICSMLIQTGQKMSYREDVPASECRRLKRSFSKQVLHWCYNELPSKYRSCLLYLTVFPEGHVIRTRSLARRWVAEGLITATTTCTPTDDEIQSSSTDEAQHCLDVLFTRGFVSPVEIGAAGNIKSCTVHRQVREFIARLASDVNFVDSSLPTHLARYLSIHNRIGLQKSHSDADSKDIAAYLPSLAAYPQWKLLKVLDLEGCKVLKKKQMKSICKILLLKYLSLRNTDVTELPKQIKELQFLETLDIRQTKVRMLAKKPIVLPLLKHFLAGHKISDRNGTRTSGESVSAVELPLGIQKMKNMEILSHVKVTDSDSELTGISQLLKLRKLGVALQGKNAKLSDLFFQIEKLQRCLRSLSIWIDPLAAGPEDAGIEDAFPSLPQFVERLNISGISNGISRLVEQQHQLTKIILCEIDIKDADLRLLGRLHGLCCLRLQHNSYSDSELAFKEDEFQSLEYLLVKSRSITKISFVEKAAPKLQRVVWSSDRMDGLYGTKHLRKLKEVELNGERMAFTKLEEEEEEEDFF